VVAIIPHSSEEVAKKVGSAARDGAVSSHVRGYIVDQVLQTLIRRGPGDQGVHGPAGVAGVHVLSPWFLEPSW
jgi:hypothetical protein